jgi:hypothetical protein
MCGDLSAPKVLTPVLSQSPLHSTEKSGPQGHFFFEVIKRPLSRICYFVNTYWQL